MPDTTTDYARGFRAGIEAAENKLKELAASLRKYGYSEKAEILEEVAIPVSALAPAAPEPSEETVRRVAIAISGAPFPSKRSMEKARAAIAAMKGEG